MNSSESSHTPNTVWLHFNKVPGEVTETESRTVLQRLEERDNGEVLFKGYRVRLGVFTKF